MGCAHGDCVASVDGTYVVAVPSSGLRPDSLRSDPGRTPRVPDHTHGDCVASVDGTYVVAELTT